jgi:hypothetical protein
VNRRLRTRRPCFAGRPYVDPGALDAGREPDRPVFAFDRALGVLERAFYRHLLSAIDLDAVFGLEQLLWDELRKLDAFNEDQVLDVSNAILSRALDRVAFDPARSLKEGVPGPGGFLVELPEEPHGDCPFCKGAVRFAEGTRGNGVTRELAS